MRSPRSRSSDAHALGQRRGLGQREPAALGERGGASAFRAERRAQLGLQPAPPTASSSGWRVAPSAARAPAAAPIRPRARVRESPSRWAIADVDRPVVSDNPQRAQDAELHPAGRAI